LPKSLLVIGGGVIGVELGQMFSRLGVDVTICCRSRLLPEMDPEVSAALKNYLEAEGVGLLQVSAISVSPKHRAGSN
jgi:mercuric reductase